MGEFIESIFDRPAPSHCHGARGYLKQNYLPCHFTFVKAIKVLVDFFQLDGVSE